MAQPQLVQIVPGVFIEKQQRAINDALARITPTTGTKLLTPTLPPGQPIVQVPVVMSSSVYGVSIAMTWFSQWRIVSQTPSLLTLEFSNPPSAGDVLRVTLT